VQAISLKADRRRYYHSSSFVMAMLFTGLLGAAAIMIAYSGYYFGYGYFAKSAEQIIDSEIYYLSAAELEGELASVLEQAVGRPGRLYAVIVPDGSVIQGNIASLPALPEPPADGMLVFTQGATTYGAKLHTLPGQVRLLVAVDITEMLAVGKKVRMMGIVTIILMGIVIFTSFLISTFVVSRTNRIALTAKEIMDTGDLSRRIEVDGRWDDLSHMAGVLNAFLARIENLLVGIRRVSDNIAHDLRTPLTRLRNNLETLRGSIPEGEPRSNTYDALIGEADRLLNTFNALLRIARIETSKQKTQFRDFDLAELLRDVVELYEPLAEGKAIQLSTGLPEGLPYHGDSDLLFQAVANLLDNAIKFTPQGGAIELSLSATGPHITVRDSGPGIPPQDQAKVFDRFYRAEASRTTPGNGLGLSLVAAVVALHDGTISLKNVEPGLEISIRL
jgi:signal transduction histidine kinase